MRRIALLVLVSSVSFGSCLYAHDLAPAAERSCQILLDGHLARNPRFQKFGMLAAVLDGKSQATILIRWKGTQAKVDLDMWLGLGGDLGDRPNYLIPLTTGHRSKDHFTILTGTPAEILAETASLEDIHGGHYLSFQLLLSSGSPTNVVELPLPSRVATTDDLHAVIGRIPAAASHEGVALYDGRTAETYFLIPNAVGDALKPDFLSRIGIVRKPDASRLNVSRLHQDKSWVNSILRTPKYTLVSPGAFRVLRSYAENNRKQPGPVLSQEFADFLFAKLIDPREVLRARVTELKPEAWKIVEFWRSELPGIDPGKPGAASEFLHAMWPADAGPVPDFAVLKNDVLLVEETSSVPARKRIEKAWALVSAAILR